MSYRDFRVFALCFRPSSWRSRSKWAAQTPTRCGAGPVQRAHTHAGRSVSRLPDRFASHPAQIHTKVAPEDPCHKDGM